MRFARRRLLRVVLTLFGVLVVSFLLVRINSDPAALLLGQNATPAAVTALNHAYGFDRSLPVQFLDFLGRAVRGDFGTSLTHATPALPLVVDHLGATLELAATGFALGFGVAFVLAVAGQLWGGQRVRAALVWIATMTQAVPPFLLGVLLVLVFAIRLKVFPALGSGGLAHLVLPAVTLAAFELSLYLRLLMVSFLEQAEQDYVRTALSKGQSYRSVVLRHIVPNALIPTLTVAGVNLGNLIGGTIIVETVFAWPGDGQLIYTAVTSQDYAVVQVGVVVIGVCFVVINIIVDVLTSLIDPRVKL